MRPNEVLSIVSTSFGPCGNKKMCVDHGGKAVITSEGVEILGMTEEREQSRGRTSTSTGTSTSGRDRIPHYLIKLTRDSCKKHSLTAGDGSIHLAILVLTGLSKLQSLSKTKEGKSRLIQLKNNFQVVVAKFEEILEGCLQESGQRVRCVDAIFNLAFTKLACKCSPRIGKTLARLVVALLTADDSNSSQQDLLSFYTRYNSTICIPDQLVRTSQVLPGICLSLSANSVRFSALREASTKFVAINCSLDDFDCSGPTDSTNVRVQSSSDYVRVTNAFESLTFRRMQRLKGRFGVSAIISTQKLGDTVKMFGQQLEMDLLFCPEEDEVRRLCSAFEILVLDDLTPLLQEEEGEEDKSNGGSLPPINHNHPIVVHSWIGQAKAMKVFAKGSALILNVKVPETSSSAKRHLRSIVLCAPSYASCVQYSRLLREALLVVAEALVDSEGGEGVTTKIVPGACLVEKLLLIEIANTLATSHSHEHEQGSLGLGTSPSLRLGLEILHEMVRGPAFALGENIVGKGVDCYLFTDAADVVAPAGGSCKLVHVGNETSINGIPGTRLLTKQLKFQFHPVLKRYRYLVHVDASPARIDTLVLWLRAGLITDVLENQDISLFVREHPDRKELQEEVEFLKLPGRNQQPRPPLDLWDAKLSPIYYKVNAVPLPHLRMFVLDTTKTQFVERWHEIYDVLVEWGLWRDQIVFGYVLRDYNIQEIKFYKMSIAENALSGRIFPDCDE